MTTVICWETARERKGKHNAPCKASFHGPRSGLVRGNMVGYSAECGMLNALVIPLIEVVFPPQSTYWYIS